MITIIILILLAGISIQSIRKVGLFEKTKEAEIENRRASIEEWLTLQVMNGQAEQTTRNTNDIETLKAIQKSVIKNQEELKEYSKDKIVTINEVKETKEPYFTVIVDDDLYKVKLSGGKYERKVEEAPSIKETDLEFTYTTKEWTNKEVTVSVASKVDIEGYTLMTSIDGCKTWEEKTTQTFSENGTLYVALYNGTNYGKAASVEITNIDKKLPTNDKPEIAKKSTDTVTIKSNQKDDESGVKEYYYSVDGGVNWSTAQSTDTYQAKNLVSGTTYKITTKVKDRAGNEAISENVEYTMKNEFKAEYTGKSQKIIIPDTGTYKLEVWGAQGGTDGAYLGGYGAYSVGNIRLQKGQELYVFVGEKGYGGRTIENEAYEGAFPNGGKTIVYDPQYRISSSAGGGSTHIALTNTLIENMANNLNDLLIVAGAGGGSCNWWRTGDNAGNGGGIEGSTTTRNFSGVNPTGGNQTTGGYGGGNLDGHPKNLWLAGAFGIGGGNAFNEDPDISGAGGGGFYGGGASWGGSGAGGSGYIGNSLLTDKHMAGYNVTTSNDESTKTISVKNASETPTPDYAKIGNGYAKITYIGE